MLVYRGEYGPISHDQPFHTRLPVIYFGDLKVAQHYAFHPNQRGDVVMNPRVIAADITIHRPVINTPHDPYIEMTTVIEALGITEAVRIANKFKDWITQTSYVEELCQIHTCSVDSLIENPDILRSLYFQAYPYFSDAEEVALLKLHGFDGAIHGGSGYASAGLPEYCIFDSCQACIVGA